MTASPNWQERYHAKHIITLRVQLQDQPGALARLLGGLGDAGASIGEIRIGGAAGAFKTREIQVFVVDDDALDRVIDVANQTPHVRLDAIIDDVLESHRGGVIETRSRSPLDTVMDLRMVYTPGVASVCSLISERPDQAWKYTAKGRKIAIVTNGTAVLGLGDIGPLAGLPVMEGKAAILARFVGVSAEPMLIDSHDPDEIVDIVTKTASQYGAIQLEDIGAPACFEIEDRLQQTLDVPVFHDDQHGTATVAAAGLINALARTGRDKADARAVILGAGAAGLAIARFLINYGVGDVVVCDSKGAIHVGRDDLNPWKRSIAEASNRDGFTGDFPSAMQGRDVFIGVSRPNMVTPEMVQSMADDPIVFALANPVSEISVEDARAAGAAVAVDGRGMNNALAYPGLFRGALDVRAREINPAMRIAAAEALAEMARGDLLPEMLDPRVHAGVTNAVATAAMTSGVARRPAAPKT